MISHENIILPGDQYVNDGTLNFNGNEIVLDTLLNTGKIILQSREIILNIKNIQGFENIFLDNVEKLTLVNIESNVNLSHLERCAPKLSELTMDSCTGLSNERENLILCDRLLSKKIAIYLINMSKLDKAYWEYLSSFPRPIQSDLDFNQHQDIRVIKNPTRRVLTLTDEAMTTFSNEFNERNLKSGAIIYSGPEENKSFTTIKPERFVQQLAGYTTRFQSMANTERSNTPQSASTLASENPLTRSC